ncbi:hypothetical protein [Sphaerisporangium rhizosphaerae]|uniref:Uncharacterized protein n=1 Tax=Sphaerisporangium rhizosphaerae TaxID=2269375 RepID=A0ABW2P0V2_9ACTN
MEAIKAVPNLAVALITLSAGWIVGNRLTARWDEHKKRRELDLQALGAFYAVYGQFFALWKLWSGAPSSLPDHDEFRRTMLERTAAAEGELESLLVRLAGEHNLSARDRVLLGCFRQGFQSLRLCVKANKPLQSQIYRPGTEDLVTVRWDGSEAPPYIAFKALSGHVADLLAKGSAGTKPERAFEALREITHTRLSRVWVNETFDILQVHHPEWPPPEHAC